MSEVETPEVPSYAEMCDQNIAHVENNDLYPRTNLTVGDAQVMLVLDGPRFVVNEAPYDTRADAAAAIRGIYDRHDPNA